MSYPIHYAASAKFSRSSSKEKMVPITQELLKGNANPLLTFNQKGDSIIHDIFENEGIVEPFLEIPDLDLEARDSNGRTYLLAACSTADNYWRNYDMEWLVAKPSPAQVSVGGAQNFLFGMSQDYLQTCLAFFSRHS